MFTKYYDLSSPYLKQALSQRDAWKEVVLTLTRPEQDESGSGATEDYLVVTLKDMMPTAYTLTNGDDARLEESLSFSYRSIHFLYEGQYEVELDAVDIR